MNPRNIIVDVFVPNGQGWSDDSIRSFVRQGYTIYRMRRTALTISGRETFGDLSRTPSDYAYIPGQKGDVQFFRIKFPYTEQGKQMITWMMMQVGGSFKILDTSHRKEVCSDDS